MSVEYMQSKEYKEMLKREKIYNLERLHKLKKLLDNKEMISNRETFVNNPLWEYNDKGYHPPEVKNSDACIACGLCTMLCPDFAIYIEDEDRESKD